MNKQLQNKLKVYSALTAVAGLVASNAEAQIVHTNVNYTGGYETYDIDIDGDGTNDFAILAADWGDCYGFPGNLINIEAKGTNDIIVATNGYTPELLSAGVAVNSTAGFYVIGSIWGGCGLPYVRGLYLGGTYSSSAAWGSAHGQNGFFMGVSFDISGATHYGWLRMNASADLSSWTLVDMAYNSEAGEQINTGQTLNVKENKRNTNIFVDSDNVNIMTDGSLMNAKVDVVNMLGQSVAKTVITSNATSLAKSFGSGIFIVRISDENGKVITRKIKI